MANRTSQHILGTSANLLGFCLFIITSLHVGNFSKNTIIDEVTSIVALFLTASSIFSFISIRTNDEKKEAFFEKLADYFFFSALIGIFLVIVTILLTYWDKH